MPTAVFSSALLPRYAEKAIRQFAELLVAGVAQELTRNTTATGAEADRVPDRQCSDALLGLAHAAEYLADARRFSIAAQPDRSHVEAIHILKRLSRSLFEEIAGQTMRRQQLEEWLRMEMPEVFGPGGEAAN